MSAASFGKKLVTALSGDELFVFEGKSGIDQYITAANLKIFVGGDIAAPSIRPERGAHSTKLSDFPNAANSISEIDKVTGLQNGTNVNFSLEQIVMLGSKPIGATGTFMTQDGKRVTITSGIITSID
jgi:hypothetical protein